MLIRVAEQEIKVQGHVQTDSHKSNYQQACRADCHLFETGPEGPELEG